MMDENSIFPKDDNGCALPEHTSVLGPYGADFGTYLCEFEYVEPKCRRVPRPARCHGQVAAAAGWRSSAPGDVSPLTPELCRAP